MAEELKTYTIIQNGLPFPVQLYPSTAKEMGLQEAKQAVSQNKRVTPANKAATPTTKKAPAKAKVEDVVDEEDLV